MQLLYAKTSPYARKVVAVAHETGLIDAITLVPAAAAPTGSAPEVAPHNPLAKVPTLVLDDGASLYDSRVICEYLDARAGGRLFPEGAARWDALVRQALADGILDAALLTRYERTLRPEPLRWDAWDAGQLAKVAAALDRIEAVVGAMPLDIGAVAIGCALGYLDFRFPELAWREARPAAAAWYEAFRGRTSMTASAPEG